MFEIVRENSSRDRKFVPYREKLERQREREREREREAMQYSWGKFQGNEYFVRDKEIFEIEGSQDRESPL